MNVLNIHTAILLSISQPSFSQTDDRVIREERVEHAGAVFRVVKLEPKQVQLVWLAPEGEPFRTFDRVQAHRETKGETVKFLMNAGIFEPGGIPSGLHIEESPRWW